MKKTQKRVLAFILALCMLSTTALSGIIVNAAATQTIYVVTVASGDNDFSKSYTYDSNGMIKKVKDSNGNTYNYTGKSGKTTKIKSGSGSYKETTTFTYNKKNQLTKKYNKATDGLKCTTVYTYDKKKRVTKTVYKESGPEAMGTPLTSKYSYNKKGYVTKEKQSGFQKDTITYSYDSKGNMTKSKSSMMTVTVKNTYEDGNLTTQKQTTKYSYGDTSTSTYTYTYKKVTVPKKYIKTVKAEQRAILNSSIPQFVY